MRKTNQEIKDTAIIEEILSTSIICRIAMTDGERPYLLPFNYGYNNNCIYIHSALKGKKLDVLRKNNSVCFEIEHKSEIIKDKLACKWTTLYRSVVGYGTIEIIEDFNEKIHGLTIIMTQHGAPDITDFKPQHVDRMVILKLTVSKLTGKQSSNWERLNNK
ncbi:MAG: pyridoxamine 5'-phosphate oxidase family protein [Bacteroidales bacterium]|nr:pyridoxamine 5'-phosphate oxidase family protein [Bacteroidales bacterium]